MPDSQSERERDEAVNALRDIAAIGVGTTSARDDALEMQRLALAALPGGLYATVLSGQSECTQLATGICVAGCPTCDPKEGS